MILQFNQLENRIIVFGKNFFQIDHLCDKEIYRYKSGRIASYIPDIWIKKVILIGNPTAYVGMRYSVSTKIVDN